MALPEGISMVTEEDGTGSSNFGGGTSPSAGRAALDERSEAFAVIKERPAGVKEGDSIASNIDTDVGGEIDHLPSLVEDSEVLTDAPGWRQRVEAQAEQFLIHSDYKAKAAIDDPVAESPAQGRAAQPLRMVEMALRRSLPGGGAEAFGSPFESPRVGAATRPSLGADRRRGSASPSRRRSSWGLLALLPGRRDSHGPRRSWLEGPRLGGPGETRRDPLLGDGSAPLGGRGEVKEVEVMAAAREWGEGLGLSSSDDSDDFFRNRRQSKVVARPRGSDPGCEAVGLANRMVEVTAAEKEWGEGLGLSSSSGGSSGSAEGPARPWQKKRRPGGGAGGESGANGSSAGAPGVIKVSQEWKGGKGGGGISLTDSEGAVVSDADLKNGGRAQGGPVDRGRRAAPTNAGGDGQAPTDRTGAPLGKPKPAAPPVRKPICPQMQWTGWLAFSLLHVLDGTLRTACLYAYAISPWMRGTFLLEALLMVMGAALSTYITFHDADVLLWMHKQPANWQRITIAAAAFIVLGCFQVIQVKRAWARQLQSAEVLTEMGDADGKDRGPQGAAQAHAATNANAMPRFAEAERIMPVALFTGVPFLLVNHLWDSKCYLKEDLWWASQVILAANLVVALTVSLGVSGLDYEVSHHVWKRYHLRDKTDRVWLKTFFPLLHKSFRAVEIYFRMTTITGLIVIAKRKNWSKDFFIVPPLLSYLHGVALLNWNSPDKERCLVHVLAGVGYLFADLGHFVDRQNFASPARKMSIQLMRWRFIEFLFVAISLQVLVYVENQGACGRLTFKKDVLPLLVSAGIYYLMGYFFPLRRLGDDLHTAAAAGKLKGSKLLQPDPNGQVLDVNMAAKDGVGMTPLMFAAEAGHLEAIEVLLDHGANINQRTESTGDTCLHYAAANRQEAACRLLVQKGADRRFCNSSQKTPEMLVPPDRPGLRIGDLAAGDAERPGCAQRLRDILRPPEEPAGDKGAQGSSPSKNTRYLVQAENTAGLPLQYLFPEVEKDDTPSPRVLQSVSALVVSRAAGGLARRVLARQDESGNGVPLGALRRVRELGRGGFGRVIEVELPPSSRSLLHRQSLAPTKYALKLQLKRDQCQAHSEVLALRRAAHPFIVHLERAFSFDKFFALLLELCPTDLNRVLCAQDENGRSLGLPAAQTAKYMGQVLLALAFLHQEEKIVFRDIKPENILISGNDEAKLTDFGLAKVVVTSAERMTMCGTMGFLAPELTATGVMADVLGAIMGDETLSQGSTAHPGPSLSKKSGGFDVFKTDTYAFGVTLQVTLLGEDGARRRIVHRKGPMMLPLHLTEEENTELLGNLQASGRLSREAYELLVEHLLPYEPKRRRRLTHRKVHEHDFFLKELGIRELKELLPGSHSAAGMNRARSVGSKMQKTKTEELTAKPSWRFALELPGLDGCRGRI